MIHHRPPMIAWLLGAALALACATSASADTTTPRYEPKLLVRLPDDCPTPDGMAIHPDGDLVVACPNFADPTQPACVIKIDPQLRVTRWLTPPPMEETGRACPMGIAFGPDGDLFVCDNQNWPTGNGPDGEINQGRILRWRIRDGRIERETVVAQGISHPNGIRVHQGQLYVTVSLLPKIRRDDGLLTSAVYRFDIDDREVEVSNTLDDENLLVTFVTYNRDCQYGADGLDFDSQGNLFVGNFGDGALHKVTFDDQGRVTGNTVFARTDFDTPMDHPDFAEKMVQAKMRSVDGICIDEHDNIYVADFSNNAVCRVDPTGRITVLAQSPDGDGSDGGLDQPAEPIFWQGRLVITCFDLVTGPDKVNTGHETPHTITSLQLD